MFFVRINSELQAIATTLRIQAEGGNRNHAHHDKDGIAHARELLAEMEGLLDTIAGQAARRADVS